ncbi:flap endonuclease-1 [Candidatus Woesearchaeota archaeon]|nr:flap endonuclease-1 [Candidatus Woesearchaeota archaeon]
MGVNLRDLTIRHEINLSKLTGKKIAIDAYNIIFQFLSSIRQRDGTPLMDSEGNITSHLSGLFYRTSKILEQGIKPCFVFDGRPPEEKRETVEARKKIREEAREKYEAAKAAGRLAEARKYAQQTSKLTKEMVSESKELISAMGLPWIQAIADGEAQAAYMANKGQVWAVVSQDYDTLLFGTPRLIRNFSMSKNQPLEMIDLSETLNFLAIDINAFIKIAILVGTDYNPKGYKGIGPKTALKIVRRGDFQEYADKISNWRRIQKIFTKPPITIDYTLNWTEPNEEKLRKILIERHEFSAKRVNNALKRILKGESKRNQKGLGDYL